MVIVVIIVFFLDVAIVVAIVVVVVVVVVVIVVVIIIIVIVVVVIVHVVMVVFVVFTVVVVFLVFVVVVFFIARWLPPECSISSSPHIQCLNRSTCAAGRSHFEHIQITGPHYQKHQVAENTVTPHPVFVFMPKYLRSLSSSVSPLFALFTLDEKTRNRRIRQRKLCVLLILTTQL